MKFRIPPLLIAIFALPLFLQAAEKKETADDRLLKAPIITLGIQRQLPFNIRAGANDYVSFAIYLWPNPISPTAPYVTRDGQKNQNLIALGDAPKKDAFFKTIKRLSDAYSRTGEARFGHLATQWICAWMVTPATRMNPHLIYAQIAPNHATVGNGGGIIDFWDFPSVLTQIKRFETKGFFSAPQKQGVHQWLKQYLDFLRTSEQGINASKRMNNHRIYYVCQLAAIEEFLGNPQNAAAEIEKIFNDLDSFFDSDGSQPHEMKRAKPFDYCLFTLRAWGELNAISLRLGKDYRDFKSPNGISLNDGYRFLKRHTEGDPEPFHEKLDPKRLDSLNAYFPKG